MGVHQHMSPCRWEDEASHYPLGDWRAKVQKVPREMKDDRNIMKAGKRTNYHQWVAASVDSPTHTHIYIIILLLLFIILLLYHLRNKGKPESSYAGSKAKDTYVLCNLLVMRKLRRKMYLKQKMR
uniref:Uncharacterized protein n=1 Tax=Romanomermis culicivorax TaxID=13658 RepID=A0A915HJK6_ROMCU